ncbi:hypothetical protein JCM1841_000123 [Sporobolomyces salmonicolor]
MFCRSRTNQGRVEEEEAAGSSGGNKKAKIPANKHLPASADSHVTKLKKDGVVVPSNEAMALFVTDSPDNPDQAAQLALASMALDGREDTFNSQFVFTQDDIDDELFVFAVTNNNQRLQPGRSANPDTLLELIRNEILRSSGSPSPASALLASRTPPSASSPRRRTFREYGVGGRHPRARPAPAPTRSPAPAIAGNLAELLLDDGVEAWLASAMLPPPSPRSATLDSGASHTMCGDASLFANLRRCKPSPMGGIGGTANALIATGVGSLCIQLRNGRTVTIKNALLVEGLSTILISSGQLWDLHGVASHFAEHATLTRNGTVVATGSRTKGSLYLLDGVVTCPLPTQGQVTGLKVEGAQSKAECNICQVAHATRLPFSSSDSLASHPLELVHSDVLSVDAASLAGKRYVVTFVDDFSCRLWVEPLDRKSDVFEAFKRFKATAETESGRKLQHLRSDNGGEYSSCAFRAYLDEHGIAFESPPPYPPASNGVAERVNRSILEGIRAMLLQAGANKSLWAEALLAFVFVIDPESQRIVRSRDTRFQEDLFPLASAPPPATVDAITPNPRAALADNSPLCVTVDRDVPLDNDRLRTPAPMEADMPAAPRRASRHCRHQ